MSKRSLFGRSRSIERRIDEFLDKVSETAMVMVATTHHQLETGPDEIVERKITQVADLKRACSALRREIEAELYSEMLIPDLLGDVVALIEALNRMVESVHHSMRFGYYARQDASLEMPPSVRKEAAALASTVGAAVDAVVCGSRAFFRDFTQVRDWVHKVAFYESECDEIRDRLLIQIYGSSADLALKNHAATRVREMDAVADFAERIADSLTIYAIKRSE